MPICCPKFIVKEFDFPKLQFVTTLDMVMMSKLNHERQCIFLLTCSKFDEVTLLPHLRNKWIAVKVCHELILLYSDNIDPSLFTLARFKNAMRKSGQCSTFLNDSNKTGYFYTESSWSSGGIPLKCAYILVKTQGSLPSSHSSAYNNIIIEIPPPGAPNNMYIPAGSYPLLHLQSASDPASNNKQLLLMNLFHQVFFILHSQQNQPIV